MRKSGIFFLTSVSVVHLYFFDGHVYFRFKSTQSDGHGNLGQAIVVYMNTYRGQPRPYTAQFRNLEGSWL